MQEAEYSFLFGERVLPLHAMLMSCGRSRAADLCYDWHGLRRGDREFIVWQYTLGGVGLLEYEGKTHKLERGDAMLVHIPHEHRYRLAPEPGYWEFVYLCANGSEVMRLCREIVKTHGPTAKFADESSPVGILNEILDLSGNCEIRNPYTASHLAYRWLMALCAELAPFGHQRAAAPPWVSKVTEYCQENLDGKLEIANLAKIAGYSQFHFSRLFHEHMKIPPAAFVRNLRLRRATRLLQTEKMGIKEIAEVCGFSSASYFCRAFQQANGQSPAAFRKGR